MPEYRIATEADLPILANMRYAYWLEDGQDPAEMDEAAFLTECEAFLQQGLVHGQWTYWLAEVAGEIVAHVFVQRVAKVPKPSKVRDAFGYVTNVYTKPQCRGRGIGAGPLQQVKDWAQLQDLEFLILWPSEASREFYERAGFKDAEAVECSVRPYIN